MPTRLAPPLVFDLALPTLHFIDVITIGDQHWAVCACRRWLSLPMMTKQAAASLTCGIEDEELASRLRVHLFRQAVQRGSD